MTEKGQKYLSDIIRAINLIRQLTETTVSFHDYSNDLKTQSAVERQLGIIGEAVNKYNVEIQDQPLENSRKIIGFRNRIVHAYDSIDNSIVWVIIQKYLEPLYQEAKSKFK